MQPQNTTQINPLNYPGKVIVLEAQGGTKRQEILQHWLDTAQMQGANTWLISCDFDQDGIWAGLKEFLLTLLPEIESKAPALIEKHAYELTLVLPQLRDKIAVSNPNLTDLAQDDEKVRNYPVDRAYRILHGLIDLLESWYRSNEPSPWVIACDRFSLAGTLVNRFFRELMRRRGAKLHLTLILATDPGTTQRVTAQFVPSLVESIISLDLPCDPPVTLSPTEFRDLAEALEQQIGRDPIEAEIYLPRLIHYWRWSDQPERALNWQGQALGLYNHQGFYEDALVYSEVISQKLEHLCGEDEATRWNVVGNIFGCNVAMGKVQLAKDLVEREALAKLKDPRQQVRVYYVMAMLYSRFLPPSERDLQQAEAYLEKSLSLLPDLDLPEHEKHFLIAFTMNGLALVRHRQGLPKEAIRLCQQASERLNLHLDPERHRLHRSVLLYNIAQVYGAMSEYEEAIAKFSETLALDPNYSEYHNERGNMYLKLGRFDEAIDDYLIAIELSPPYSEVWENLGLCYRLRGQLKESIEAYTMALDLKPDNIAALVGLGQAWEMMGEIEAALNNYTAALTLNPEQPMLLANRAILYYELGNVTQAVVDLDRAIMLSPDTSEFYQNRAIALIALGRANEAARDLQTYLELNPNAEDRTEVETELKMLLAN